MKRMANLILLIVLTALISVSCKSTGKVESFTDEQYDYALHLVLDQAQSKAISDLFKQFNEFNASLIPDRYSEIERCRDDIPGMDLLIRRWTEYSSLFILQGYGSFTDYAEKLKGKVSFNDPKALLEEGEDSVSRYYSSLHLDDVAREISKSIRDIDYSTLRKALIQYNAWASTRNRLYDEDIELLDTEIGNEELTEVFAYHLAGLFFGHLAASESLIRTTPDLSMDSVEAMVLGLI